MKTARFFLTALVTTLILSGCATGFHRQKYTDFGHARGMRFREALPEKPAEPKTDVPAQLLNESEDALPETTETVSVPVTDSLESAVIEPEKEPLPTAPASAIAAIAQRGPADTISKPPLILFGDHPVHNKGFLVTGFILAGIAIIYFAVSITAPMWLTTAVILMVLGLLFILLAHAKSKPAPVRTPQPDRPKQPVEGDERFYTMAQDIRMISLLAYIMLLIFMVATVAGFLYPLAFLFGIAALALLTGISLLLAAVMSGSRYKKRAREQHFIADEGILRMQAWNIFLLAFFFFVTLIALAFLLLVVLSSWG